MESANLRLVNEKYAVYMSEMCWYYCKTFGEFKVSNGYVSFTMPKAASDCILSIHESQISIISCGV